MIKAKIKRQNIVTNSAPFDTQQLATAWVNETKLTGAFGKLERWLTESQAISEGSDIADAVDVAEITNPFPGPGEPQTYMIYKFPAEFEIEYEDITAEEIKKNIKRKAIKSQDAGREIIAAVWSINEAKFASGQLNQQQFQNLLADNSLTLIERLLMNGSLRYSKTLVQSYPGNTYSAAEKAEIIALIDEKIAAIHGG